MGKACGKCDNHSKHQVEEKKIFPTFGNAPSKKKASDNDGASAGTKDVIQPPGGPKFSFGSRFDSDIRAKPHLKPKKMDGPGPGDYALPSSIENKSKNHCKNGVWGGGERDWAYLRLDNDKGDKGKKGDYVFKKDPQMNNTAPADLPGYSFPKAERKETAPPKISKRANDLSMLTALPKLPAGYAKTMLGGSIATKKLVDNGVPGPGAYNPGDDNDKSRHVPGVKISEPPKRKDTKS